MTIKQTQKATPGPWELIEEPYYCGYRYTIKFTKQETGRQHRLALLNPAHTWQDPLEVKNIGDIPYRANVRLMAVAPTMATTLRAIVARINGEWDNPDLVAMGPLSVDSSDDIRDWSEAAIAKAEGREVGS